MLPVCLEDPAVEDQASDRAHRMGQQRPVTIYRLVAKHTIEEGIVELHKHKRDLADSLELDSTALSRSLRELRIADPLDEAGWRGLVERLVRENGGGDLAVYLQVTRGAPAKRSHAFPDGTGRHVYTLK